MIRVSRRIYHVICSSVLVEKRLSMKNEQVSYFTTMNYSEKYMMLCLLLKKNSYICKHILSFVRFTFRHKTSYINAIISKTVLIMSYSIYNELTKRVAYKDSNRMECRLKILLDKIKTYSEGHLSQVNRFLPEYDDHSVKHAEGVLGNIDRIIGEEGIKKLSVYDLFILAASAYLHDWGMALTGYEEKVLEIAEQESLPVAEKSVEACNNIINENDSSIFGRQIQDALDNKILPHKKEDLIEHLSNLYQKYQDYRNGYSEKYKNANDDGEREIINKDIRQDFIRETHHKRSAEYVINWGKCIQKDDINLSSIMYDVAHVVQSHGELDKFVKDLSKVTDNETIDDVEGSDEANLQFASTMLRLGDIVHFTFDRAPVSLRKEILFNSSYSRDQWLIKNGVSNKIVKGENQTTISFKAKCELPRSYCYLKKYIGYINLEIDLFNKLQSNWAERYQISLVPVVDHVDSLDNAFDTKPDLKFSLNQNKIIELLMGVQLYKDPYTCLRELYQNSLDACRCAISRRKSQGEEPPKCTIEFGVKKDEGGKYIYCLDDGKGMSRNIIEKYFLNIGSSYYKSKDFYSERAQYNADFTPTSQFGIGILSCFMIGDRLEVVTKEYEGELILFGVDGPQETFYYWNNNKICREDNETFRKRHSGTLVKVYLKEQYAKEIDDGELDKFELLKCCDFYWNKIEEKRQSGDCEEKEKRYIDLFSRWKRHIYYKIFDFVQIPFPDVNVQVYFAHKRYPIEARPHFANLVSDEEFEKYGYYFGKYGSSEQSTKNSHMVEYPFQICRANYIYHSMLCLPIVGSDRHYNQYTQATICVDGVKIGYEDAIEDGVYKETLMWLTKHGIFNFVGEHKPALKVDRCSFVNEIHIDEAEKLFSDYVKNVVRIVKDHIKLNYFYSYQSIWGNVILDLPDSLKLLMTNEFDQMGYPNIESIPLLKYFRVPENVSAIMSRQLLTRLQLMDSGTLPVDVFLIKKMSAIKSVTALPDGNLHLSFGNLPMLPFINCSINRCAIAIPEDIGQLIDYDIVDKYYPMVSRRLFYKTKPEKRYYINEHDVRILNLFKFERFVNDWWIEIHERRRGWYIHDSMVNNNKHITIYHMAYPYVSDGFNDTGYLSICLHDNRNTHLDIKEYSLIMPLQWKLKTECLLFVVEEKLTREEMDEIYLFVSKKLKVDFF